MQELVQGGRGLPADPAGPGEHAKVRPAQRDLASADNMVWLASRCRHESGGVTGHKLRSHVSMNTSVHLNWPGMREEQLLHYDTA